MSTVIAESREGGDEASPARYSDDQRQVVFEQLVDAYAKTQDSYDTTIRSLAAGGVAITVSIGTALHAFGMSGAVAVSLFLGSLGLNLGSFATVQRDIKCRLGHLTAKRDAEAQDNAWRKLTTVLNIASGTLLLAGGIALAILVSSST